MTFSQKAFIHKVIVCYMYTSTVLGGVCYKGRTRGIIIQFEVSFCNYITFNAAIVCLENVVSCRLMLSLKWLVFGTVLGTCAIKLI